MYLSKLKLKSIGLALIVITFLFTSLVKSLDKFNKEDSMSNYFAPSDQPTGQGTGSYAAFYNAATQSLGFVTESNFRPFVTDIGLYSENNELLAHGKLAKPIKLSDDIETTFIVRFDV